ncbi:MAG: hypothetical protein M3Q23_00695 [Actinomycetota bacterium]|nr:hypothetical protein [Actinomycetota bacterium]
MRRRVSLVTLVLLAASLVLNLSASPARAAFVGRNGWVAFSALAKNGSIQVYREGDNGLEDVTGTRSTGPIMRNDNFSPTFSPEHGAHLAFVSATHTSTGRGPGDIWIVSPFPDLPSNSLANLTKSPTTDDQSPSWDFTGGHVAYSSALVVSGQDAAADIWKVTWTGRLPQDLTPGTVSDDIQPAWSPRTHVIAFVSNRTVPEGTTTGPSHGIWLMDSGDGEVLGQLTDDGTHPNWRADGKKIAFVRDGDIWIMNDDGSEPMGLTHHTGSTEFTNPAWSNDGTKIAFQVDGGAVPVKGSSLMVMDANGKAQKVLLHAKQFVGQSEPDWRADCSVEPHKKNGKFVITGTNGPDLLCFEKFPTTVFGRGGDDSIYGGPGNNVVDGGPGNDIILGAKGNDVLKGGTGNDYLEGDEGLDSFDGGAGIDQCNGDPGESFSNCETIRQLR